MDFLILIIWSIILALIPATIARTKGRNFGLWYVYGLALFIVALIHSLCISKSAEKQKEDALEAGLVECPYCKEFIKEGAKICKHCKKELSL